jgi:hypothetical protein
MFAKYRCMLSVQLWRADTAFPWLWLITTVCVVIGKVPLDPRGVEVVNDMSSDARVIVVWHSGDNGG